MMKLRTILNIDADDTSSHRMVATNRAYVLTDGDQDSRAGSRRALIAIISARGRGGLPHGRPTHTLNREFPVDATNRRLLVRSARAIALVLALIAFFVLVILVLPNP
jgi:hypothetical protein